MLEAKGDIAGAEPFYAERYRRSVEVLGPDHESTLIAQHNLGYLRFRQNRLDEAATLFQGALTGRQRLLGPEHPETLFTLSSLGNTKRLQQHWEDAERILKDALTRHERAFGSDHDETLDAVSALALVYRDQKQYAHVEPLARRAYEGHLGRHGADDPTTRSYGSDLAVSLASTGRATEAEALARELLAGSSNDDPEWPAHEPRLPLAVALTALGRYSEAEGELGRIADALGAEGPKGLKRLVNEAYEALYENWQRSDPPNDLEARRTAARARWARGDG
jgi:tetratricopeptide (TPR) repeat protein